LQLQAQGVRIRALQDRRAALLAQQQRILEQQESQKQVGYREKFKQTGISMLA
jgi:hypothetical protein